MQRAEPRKGLPKKGKLRVRFNRRTLNRKTGPIPVTITSASTCPPSCSWYGAGCFAENHLLGHHWRKTNELGVEWDVFCELVRRLPNGQLWRHNEGGDLPGIGEEIDYVRLEELIAANEGRRGFTYTHKPMDTAGKRAIIQKANSRGFTINLSADNLAHADELTDLGIAPVTAVLEHDAPQRMKTPAGRTVTVCPAETHGIQCIDCKMCAVSHRKAIVGFRAHGNLKYLVSERAAKRPNLQLPLINNFKQQLIDGGLVNAKAKEAGGSEG